MGIKQKIQSKLATHWGAYYDPEIGKDVWPHYAVKKAVRDTFIGIFVLLNLVTYFLGGSQGLNTGALPTGLSTTRAIIFIGILLLLYGNTVNTMGQAMNRIPVIKYEEDMTEETESTNSVVSYVEKKYDEDDE